MYCKRQDFNGIIFAKIALEKIADEIPKKSSMAKLEVSDEQILCNKYIPSNEPVALSFLLSLRRQLVQ